MKEKAARGGRARRRILIVDDHPLVRTGLVALIGSEPDLEVCGEAGTFSAALDRARSCQPDLAVVDLSLAEGSGLELVRRLAGRGSNIRVLVCSLHDESLFAERALKAGAMGYITKQAATSHVVTAIRQVLDGNVYLSDRMTQRLLRGAPSGALEGRMPSVSDLTDRELEIFGLIGRGLSSSQIAEQLHVSVKTVEAHREKMKKRLNLRTGRELVRCAVEWTLEQS